MPTPYAVILASTPHMHIHPHLNLHYIRISAIRDGLDILRYPDFSVNSAPNICSVKYCNAVMFLLGASPQTPFWGYYLYLPIGGKPPNPFCCPLKWASPGFEPGTSCTQSRNHTPRPRSPCDVDAGNTNILEIFVIYLNPFYHEIYIHGN